MESDRLLQFFTRQWKIVRSVACKNSADTGITEEALLTLVEEAEAGGGIDKEEGTLIRSAIEFNELLAVDIFTPRIDVVGASVDTPKDEMAELFAQTGYSRIPIYENNLDNILGILYQKDFHNHIWHTSRTIREAVRPALFVPKNKKIDDLMKELQKKKLHIAIVMDEYGETAGIVTLEDILEELVGEIWDEHDEVVSEIEQIGAGEYRVSGKANVEKVFEQLHRKQEFDVHTISGWVMEQLGRIPMENDSFEQDGLAVMVTKMCGKRIGEANIREISQNVVRNPETENS